MRLIDLDAKEPYLLDGRYAIGVLDNASTVEERPQGKWTNKHFEHADCSLCGIRNDYHGDFCKYCGEDMRGEKEENKNDY